MPERFVECAREVAGSMGIKRIAIAVAMLRAVGSLERAARA
jgi:hypothetical protein